MRRLAGPLTAMLVAGVAAAGTWWLRRNLLIVDVSGPSMRPTLTDGDRVLVRLGSSPMAVGDVVVVDLPAVVSQDGTELSSLADRRIVKRVAALAGQPVPDGVPAAGHAPAVPAGTVVVLGDNSPQSVDSRQLGFIDLHGVVGVVIRRFGVRSAHEPPAPIGPPTVRRRAWPRALGRDAPGRVEEHVAATSGLSRGGGGRGWAAGLPGPRRGRCGRGR